MTSTCTRIRELLDAFRCGELLVETNHEVLAHLRVCQACATELERRHTVVTMLRVSPDVSVDAAALAARVSAQIARRRWRPPAARAWMAATAALVAVAVVAFRFAPGVPVDAAAYRDSIGDHVECALSLPAAASYDQARVARRLQPAFAALARRLLDYGGAYRLVDAHACPYHGRRYVHFVFRQDGHTQSLFVDDRPQGALPQVPVSTRLSASGTRVYRVDEARFRVAAVATPWNQLFFVSDVPTAVPDDSDAVLALGVEFVQTVHCCAVP